MKEQTYLYLGNMANCLSSFQFLVLFEFGVHNCKKHTKVGPANTALRNMVHL